jgi:hypothetical protein
MYVGIAGATPDVAGRTVIGSASNYGGFYTNNGMLLHGQQTRIRDAVDGTSNVMMVAEQSGRVGTADIRSGYYGGYTQEPPSEVSQCQRPSQMAPTPGALVLRAVQYRINSPTMAAGSDNPWDANTDDQLVSCWRYSWSARRWFRPLYLGQLSTWAFFAISVHVKTVFQSVSSDRLRPDLIDCA